MPNKKYISKIVKGGNTIHIKDEEAREAIEGLSPESVASAQTITDLVNEII